jgi:hypothetical protein
MNARRLIIAAFATFAFSANGQIAARRPPLIKLGEIEIRAPSPAEYQPIGGQQKSARWIEVGIAYETVSETIDELSFKFTLLIGGKLLDGDITLTELSKGKAHYAVMYVSPKSIEKLTGGKPLTPAIVGNAWVEASNRGQILGKKALRNLVQPSVPRIAGFLLPKHDTPFIPRKSPNRSDIESA